MRIGIVDVDTSHPGNWIPIERELGHEVVAIWDGGSVHPAGYAAEFAQQHEIPKVCEKLEDMIPDVDGVILHGCDWDTHIAKARPFVEAGKSVLIDKPIAGNLRDINQLREWVSHGARITGGSSLRYCCESQEFLAKPIEERGTPDTVLAGCGVDEFNYGIHAYSLLMALMGPGPVSVKHIGLGVQRRIQVNWPNGRMGFIVVGKAEKWIPFYAIILTEKGHTQFVADSKNLYRAELEKTLPYLSGQTNDPPVPFDALIQAELIAIAARQSWLNGDREVALSDIDPADPGYDGPSFAIDYRAARYAKK